METEIPSWSELLVAAKDSADFFRNARKTLAARNPKFSYVALADKIGFSSRSVLSEIFSGKRVPSYKAFLRLTSALGLSRAEKELLAYLIARDYPKFDRTVGAEKIDSIIDRAKARLSTKRRQEIRTPLAGARLGRWPKVYSAIGKGCGDAEIAKRTGLPEAIVSQVLRELADAGLIEKQGNRYRSSEEHLTLDPRLHQKVVESFLLEELSGLPKSVSERYADPEQLVFGAALSIRRENLGKLKRHLRQTLTQAIDQYFDSDGDTFVTLAGLLLK